MASETEAEILQILGTSRSGPQHTHGALTLRFLSPRCSVARTPRTHTRLVRAAPHHWEAIVVSCSGMLELYAESIALYVTLKENKNVQPNSTHFCPSDAD